MLRLRSPFPKARGISERAAKPQHERKHQNPTPTTGRLSDAPSTIDPPAQAPDWTDIASPQRDRAQNPVNTTRTCNKLRPVNWFTGEVR